MKFNLLEHQKEIIEFIKGKKTSLIQAGTGSGKTFCILYYANSLPDKNFVIMVHNKNMISNWEEEQIKIFGELLPNIKVIAYTVNHKIKECDVLVVDEFHFLKGIGVRWKRAKNIKYKKIIMLTATPTDHFKDWYSYLKFLNKLTSKESFYWKFEVSGEHAYKKGLKYPRYIDRFKTEMFEPVSCNFDYLETYLNQFRLKIKIDKLTPKDFKWIKLENYLINPNLDYVEKREALHEIYKNDKIKYFKKKSLIIVHNDFEKDWLLKNLESSTLKRKEFEEGKKFWIANYRVGELTGTDGIQHFTNTIYFYSPVPSGMSLVQITGRINGLRAMKEPEFIAFCGNHFETEKWKSTFKKIEKM